MSDEIERHKHYMRHALEEARLAYDSGEVPIGALIVAKDGTIIARAHNLTEGLSDVTAHAEMQAITAASNYLGAKYLAGCTMYVTLEPCIMCAGALGWSQISTIVYGASDDKRGYHTYTENPFHPRTNVITGVLKEECSELITSFFKLRR